MEYQFTPGAERVLIHAAGWSEANQGRELTAAALLLGLLDEAECRAAIILDRYGVTPHTVRRRWPELREIPESLPSPLGRGVGGEGCENRPHPNPLPEGEGTELSLNAIRAIQSAYQRVVEYHWPPILETDHLLLGLLAGNDEVAEWLKQCGVSAEAVEAEIRNRYRRQPVSETPLEDSSLDEPFFSSATVDPESRGYDSAIGAKDGPARSTLIPHPSSLIPHPSLLRLLDAAANRAREGIRVVEDFVRFVLDDRHLTEQCKQFRHDLTAALQCFPQFDFLSARETQADVGTALTTDAEATRHDFSHLLTANFSRLQESLRSLEEFSKLPGSPDSSAIGAAQPQEDRPGATAGLSSSAAFSATVKQLRYRSYTLQRAVEITYRSLERLAASQLYVLLDGRSSTEAFQQLAEQLITAGVHVLQLRDKTLNDKELLERAKLLRRLTAGTPTLFIMNDRPDLAALSQADGVHVGQEELSVKDARSIVGPAALIGVSTHSIAQARQAVLDGANYIGVGPTFPSGTKTFDQFPGLELLRAVAGEIRLPAFAIGGITLENLPTVLETGVSRVAVREALVNAPDPAAAAREFLAAFDYGFPSPSGRGQGEGCL
ncbi:MAG: thiamine phosphate synthase [Pirellulales bacterium]|nr:thiamine phosphate synthase [Pirellulales bacterium]